MQKDSLISQEAVNQIKEILVGAVGKTTVGNIGRGKVVAASTGPKIHRNEPCPCGNGLKYKKCHGKK